MTLFERWRQGLSTLFSQQPTAYTRITRTPVYVEDQPGLAGTYANGAITISPGHWDVIPHESAHQLYDQANLKARARQLAPAVGEAQRNFILASPTYRNMADAGGAEQLSDEGLGFSIGDPRATGYVDTVANAIQNPSIAAKLRRLNSNALGSRKAKEALFD